VNKITLSHIVQCLQKAKMDAERAWDSSFENMYCEHFSQTWPSAKCGFGGAHTNVSHKAPTVLIWNRGHNKVRVYHDGRFAYEITKPSARFHRDRADKQLLGQKEIYKNGTSYYQIRTRDATE